MIARAGYFLRETWVNIGRNVTLTIAAIITVALGVVFVGSAVLARQAVANASTRWQGGVEFIIFLDPDIQGAQADSIGGVSSSRCMPPWYFISKTSTPASSIGRRARL